MTENEKKIKILELEKEKLMLDKKRLELSDVEDGPGEQYGYVKGLAREAATGASFGAAPYIEAGIGTLSGDESFKEELDQVQDKRNKFKEENPKAALAADISGSMLTGGGGIGRSLAKNALMRAGAGAGESILRDVADDKDAKTVATDAVLNAGLSAAIPHAPKAMAAGLGLGGVVGAMSAEHGHEAEGALKGAGLGLAAGAGVSLTGKAAKALARASSSMAAIERWMQTKANGYAADAVGADVKAVKKELGKNAGLAAIEQKRQELGKTMLGSGVMRPLSSQKDMLKEVVGNAIIPQDPEIRAIVDAYDYYYPVMKRGNGKNSGQIAKLSDDVNTLITNADNAYSQVTGQHLTVDPVDIYEKIESSFLSKTAANPESPVTDGERKAVLNHVKELLGVGIGNSSTQYVTSRPPFSLLNLHNYKKNLGQKLSGNDFKADFAANPTKKTASVEVYRAIKNELLSQLDDISNGLRTPEMYGQKLNDFNQVIGNLIDAEGYLTKGVIDKSFKTRVSERPLMSTLGGYVGYTAGTALGGPGMGYGMGALGVAGGGTIADAVKRYGAQAAASALNQVKLKRTTSSVMANKDIVIAKLVFSGAIPLARAFEQAIEGNPEQIKLLMPSFIQKLPDLFVNTEYSSEFDGKISDPIERQTYLGKLHKRDDISNTEKAKRAHLLNKDGTITKDQRPAPTQVPPEIQQLMQSLQGQ